MTSFSSTHAAVQGFINEAAWDSAVSVITSDVRLENFDGLPHGYLGISGDIIAEGSATVRNFQGTTISPRVDNDSWYGGGWLVNRNYPGFDEFQHGFVFDFLEPVIAVALTDNPFEKNRLRIYDANDQLLGEVSNDGGVHFLGLISTSPIAYATVINLPPEDGIFAIDNLKVGVSTIPEPASFAVLSMMGLLAIRRR